MLISVGGVIGPKTWRWLVAGSYYGPKGVHPAVSELASASFHCYQRLGRTRALKRTQITKRSQQVVMFSKKDDVR